MPVSAQQRTYYDDRGKSIGRSTTDSVGTVNNTDARGKVISREFITGKVTTQKTNRARGQQPRAVL